MVEWHDLRVDGDRLWQRLEALGEIGAVHGPNGERGCARLALTDVDREGRDLVVSWMRDLGMDVAIDAIGNVVATRAGSDPTASAVMVGSHIDTVRTGGRFDGNLGVLAGLEIVETLSQHGVTTRRPIEVAFFTDEEGARFAPDMLGSLVYVGGLAVEEALDVTAADDGARLGDELARIGYAGPTPVPAATFPHAYAELHIEQGPVLEDEGTTIGVVTGVQGISWTEVTITGQSAHAGTTPMHLRHDPLAAAARSIHEIRLIAGSHGAPQVATVGSLTVVPNLVNVIPSNVVFSIDLRNTDEPTLKDVEGEVFEACRMYAADEGCDISMRTLARFEPVEFDVEMIDLVETTAQRLGHSTRRMPSGAGHDAQMLARVCPTSMVFVPSVNGLSHNIAEYTTPADIEAGANVLLQVVLDRAD
ncbi:MAG: beta-ureidopropionase / N-carbamoyl-L-amino-acid hydrolase [Ilumatobacteraceae bacterium]|jgi:N-carbamoyl-L-amino-acid hydrolase